MAGSALMLVLGFLIAVALIVFLSNSAPSKSSGGGGGGMPAVDIVAPGPQAAGGGADMTGAGGAASGTTGAAGGATAGGGVSGAGAGALTAQTYAPASSSNKDTLKSGETLAEGASLTSKNGKYVLTYDFGAITVKSGNFTMWTSPGNLTPGGVVKITPDGNLGIFPSQYSVTPSGWASATAGQGTQPYQLVMKDDGRLLLYDSSPLVIWSAPVTMPPVGVDCLMGSWGEWSACSKNCGGGVQTRNRSIITPSNTGGKACGETVETRPCNTDPCPDCNFSWSPFGQCVTQDPATGAGKKQSTLIVSSPAGPGGAVCPDPNSNIADCVNCVFSPWSPAGELSAQTCNQSTGLKTQSRTITVPASGGGTCTEPLNRQEACAVDCQLNTWGDWGPCTDKTNGVGKNTRTTTVKFQPKNGGKACTVESGVLTGTQTCDASGNCTETRPCGDCVLGTTFTYGNCDPATGRASRTRNGDTPPTNGGTSCPGTTDDVACDVNCQVSGWSDFSACDISSGQHTRTRTVTQAAKNNGTVCPALTETAACDIDCQVSGWSEWGACSKSCGGGKKTRTRTVTQEKKNNGAECPALSEEADCNTQGCAVNATYGPWGAWSACSAECNGTQTRARSQLTAAANGGSTQATTEVQACNTEAEKCKVNLYSGCGFGGNRQGSIPVGAYPAASGTNPRGYGFQDKGGAVGNDDLQSIKVPSGLKATLYQDINYGAGGLGAWTILGSDPNSKNRNFCATDSWWKDRMSSIKVEYDPQPDPTPPKPCQGPGAAVSDSSECCSNRSRYNWGIMRFACT